MRKFIWVSMGFLCVFFAVIAIVALTQQLPTITKTAEVTLTIKPAPDFTLAAQPEHIDSFTNRIASFTASITSVNEFAGEVVFSVSGLPPEITVNILPSDTLILGAGETKTIQVDIGIPLDQTLVGDYTITVTAESMQYN